MSMHPQGGVASRDQRPNAGIDVSKRHLDARWGTENQRLVNDAIGWDALIAKFKEAEVDLVVLEATGGRRQAAWPVTTSILAGWPGMNVAV
jgi:hypothetical protein